MGLIRWKDDGPMNGRRPLLRLPAAAMIAVWFCRALIGLDLPLPAAGAAALTFVLAGEAEARSSSSGGYSRPSVRTPSPSRSGSSSSGGYRRPSVSDSQTFSSSRSSGDEDLSRRGSAEALKRYRAQTAPVQTTETRRRPPIVESDVSRSSGGFSGGFSGRRGGSPPPSAHTTPNQNSGSGLGNAMMMWFLLDTLTRPGHADYFHHHQDDPAYGAWRREADQRAQDDPELREKLKALDRDLGRRGDQPKDPAFVPPDVSGSAEDDKSGFPIVTILIIGGVLFLLWRARRKRQNREAPGMDGKPLDLAGGIIRQKIGIPNVPASPFRVGMTVTIDPTPFVLAAAATKVRQPTVGGNAAMAGVGAIGRMNAAETAFDRLYLPEEQGFFQLHRQGGAVDECRYFRSIDQFTPADESEWDFWLDPAEGMIGWPTFETKDGKQYQRVWQSGSRRIEPYAFTEDVTDVDGTRTRKIQAMLYAASTGMASPAPETEYILVALMEDGGQAWIEILAGLDVNAASLSLPF